MESGLWGPPPNNIQACREVLPCCSFGDTAPTSPNPSRKHKPCAHASKSAHLILHTTAVQRALQAISKLIMCLCAVQSAMLGVK